MLVCAGGVVDLSRHVLRVCPAHVHTGVWRAICRGQASFGFLTVGSTHSHGRTVYCCLLVAAHPWVMSTYATVVCRRRAVLRQREGGGSGGGGRRLACVRSACARPNVGFAHWFRAWEVVRNKRKRCPPVLYLDRARKRKREQRTWWIWETPGDDVGLPTSVPLPSSSGHIARCQDFLFPAILSSTAAVSFSTLLTRVSANLLFPRRVSLAVFVSSLNVLSVNRLVVAGYEIRGCRSRG